MNSSTLIRPAAPDQSDKAWQVIELWTALDPEAQNVALARLIAATVHGGPGSALEHFASTGHIDPQQALEELNDVRVPIERESSVDVLGRYILACSGRRP